ncbi:hypothetical protein [Acetivibrio sp. MSJd-27]|nr:hypothetical protein [Acetivibrio sp. MSJd-27]MBU5449113.1 hypothetical protein [Acetivibrio sp. MSJd-27]
MLVIRKTIRACSSNDCSNICSGSSICSDSSICYSNDLMNLCQNSSD